MNKQCIFLFYPAVRMFLLWWLKGVVFFLPFFYNTMCNAAGDDQEDLEEENERQIVIQPEQEIYEQARDDEVSFGRPRVPNQILWLEKHF